MCPPSAFIATFKVVPLPSPCFCFTQINPLPMILLFKLPTTANYYFLVVVGSYGKNMSYIRFGGCGIWVEDGGDWEKEPPLVQVPQIFSFGCPYLVCCSSYLPYQQHSFHLPLRIWRNGQTWGRCLIWNWIWSGISIVTCLHPWTSPWTCFLTGIWIAG